MTKIVKKKKIKPIGIIILLLIVLIITGTIIYRNKLTEEAIKLQEKLKKESEEKLLKEIKNNYSEYVITINDSPIYKKIDNEYKEIGTIYKDTNIQLENIEVSLKNEYFKIISLDEEYYINYKDVNKSQKEEKDKRYLNYIKLDKEIITKENTSLYLNDKKLYSLNKSMTFSVYKIDKEKYYVQYDNNLMYILKNDIKEEKEVINNEEYAKEIPVIAYHFFYDPDKGEECNQVICHSKAQLTSHINYIKNNNFFTPTMQEFELYMEGNIRLPKKSVLITIDDGYMSKLAIQLLNENKVNATLFLITAAYDPQWYKSEYVELHSHTHNMHTQGQCPGGQGGGLKCLSKEKIASDLKKSSEILGNSTILCYPFYEFTEHTISVMKEVGYTMGFAGSGAGGTLKAKIGGNKYKIPRYTMNKNSTVDDLKKIIG